MYSTRARHPRLRETKFPFIWGDDRFVIQQARQAGLVACILHGISHEYRPVDGAGECDSAASPAAGTRARAREATSGSDDKIAVKRHDDWHGTVSVPSHASWRTESGNRPVAETRTPQFVSLNLAIPESRPVRAWSHGIPVPADKNGQGGVPGNLAEQPEYLGIATGPIASSGAEALHQLARAAVQNSGRKSPRVLLRRARRHRQRAPQACSRIASGKGSKLRMDGT